MGIKFARPKTLFSFATFAVLTLTFFEPNALVDPVAYSAGATPSVTHWNTAQSNGAVDLLLSSLPEGIARGQTLRVSLANRIRLDGREQTPVEVRVLAKLLDARGQTIAQTGDVPVTNNQVRSFDFSRDRLPLPGESGTGKLQVREELIARCIGVSSAEALILMQKALEFLPASSELIDNASGNSQGPNPLMPARKWLQAPIDWKPSTIGLVYGQTLRFSAMNFDEAGESSHSVRVRVRLLDASGNLIAQSDEIGIAPGQFSSFDFNRDDLRVAGEAGTGRLQLAWSIEASTLGDSSRPILISIEPLEAADLSRRSRVGYAYLAIPLNQG